MGDRLRSGAPGSHAAGRARDELKGGTGHGGVGGGAQGGGAVVNDGVETAAFPQAREGTAVPWVRSAPRLRHCGERGGARRGAGAVTPVRFNRDLLYKSPINSEGVTQVVIG